VLIFFSLGSRAGYRMWSLSLAQWVVSLSPLAPEIGFARFRAFMEWSKSDTSDFD
jgi:hypothetical protein